MAITPAKLAAAYKELRPSNGGFQSDYFGLLYLEEELHVPRAEALDQIAFGPHDHGIDAYHIDRKKRALNLFVFRHTRQHDQFRSGYDQMIGKRFRSGVELSGGEWQKIAIARAYRVVSHRVV